jgi:hypothetical protein
LRWVGNGTQNYNSATDTGADNTYEVIVQATNIDGFYDRQTIVITVTPMSDYMLLGEANGFAIDFIDLTITVRENNGADTLLYNEDEGFAVDFTDGSVTVIEA